MLFSLVEGSSVSEELATSMFRVEEYAVQDSSSAISLFSSSLHFTFYPFLSLALFRVTASFYVPVFVLPSPYHLLHFPAQRTLVL